MERDEEPCATSSPAQHGYGGVGGGRGGEAEAMAARVRAKLDFVSTKVAHDGDDEEAFKVKDSLDRLAFASQARGARGARGGGTGIDKHLFLLLPISLFLFCFSSRYPHPV